MILEVTHSYGLIGMDSTQSAKSNVTCMYHGIPLPLDGTPVPGSYGAPPPPVLVWGDGWCLAAGTQGLYFFVLLDVNLEPQ